MFDTDERIYIAIDLKSFYASVECVERGLDPLDTNLVVADASRTEKTICLAVSPSLKAYKIPGRARLFEVVQRVKEINAARKRRAKNYKFEGKSYIASELEKNKNLELSYIVAPPQMALYTKYSTAIYEIYLKYVAPEDMHVYSIDEVFIDITNYMKLYNSTAEDIARMIIGDVLHETGITATVGIGTNLYLCKIAMDVMAKRMIPDENGARIAYLDVVKYRKELWSHTPLTDFWRIGSGISKKLEANRLYTMGDVARCSLGNRGDKLNEDLLFKLFGKNAELLIDHAWGHEPVTMREIKEYKPAVNCKASGQVLQHAYSTKAARLVVREMADALAFDLLAEGLVTDKLTLTVGYDCSCLEDGALATAYAGPVTSDRYGREVPQHAHGTVNLEEYTASSRIITKAILELYDRLVNPKLLVRRINLSAERVVSKEIAEQEKSHGQMSLFDWEEEAGAPSAGTGAAAADADVATAGVVPAGAAGAHRTAAGGMPGAPFGAECGEGAAGVSPSSPSSSEAALLEKERFLHDAVLDVRNKFGKNAVFRAVSLQEGATARQRNNQIGGHNA